MIKRPAHSSLRPFKRSTMIGILDISLINESPEEPKIRPR
uniref:Uncharacterized protein n=1 Tax=Tetranychus urticae TaxID=32264 RepID=T1KUA9_TETUR